jgi:hypothetical protein
MTDEYAAALIAKKCMHEIHVSTRRSFRGCRRRWDWVFRQNIYPVTTARPLEFGVAFHKGMEALFNPTTWKFPDNILLALAEKAFVEVCEKQRKEYLRVKDLYALEDDEQHDYDERIDLGRGMLRYFVTRQLPKIREEFVPTHVEVSFDVPLLDAKGNQIYCKCNECRRLFAKLGGGRWKGNPLVYSGRVDLIVHDMQGGYWIWDWKTALQLSGNEMFLELDDQVASYCWALRCGLGLNIRGFIYHEQRKAYPKPPKQNKNRRLGRIFSVNVNQATDYETYLATVLEHDKEAYEEGCYDDFLEWLKTDGTDYYRRFVITKNDIQLENIGRDLLAESLDMIAPNLSIYPMPGKFSCSGCAYQTPCISKNSGLDYEYTLATLFAKMEPYYRRNQPASTERKEVSA